MSVYKQQKNSFEKRAINELLRAGRQPKRQLVQTTTAALMGNYVLGKPFFNPLKLKRNQVSDQTTFNHALTNLDYDLKLAYTETDNQAERLLALCLLQENGKSRLENKCRILNSHILALEEQLTYGSQGFTDSFTSFDQIKFDTDENINLPATNCLVDLSTSSIKLNRNKVTKHDLIDMPINCTITAGKKHLEIGELPWILNDNINENWQLVLTGDKAEITITIKTNGIDINHLHFWGDVTGSTKYTMALDETVIDPIFTGEHTVWEFEPCYVNNIVLTLSKNTPDSIETEDNYFVFTGREFEAKLENYPSFNTFVSSVLSCRPFDSVLLKTEQITPIDTELNYYLSLAFKDEPLEWQKIIPQKAVSFNFYTTTTRLIIPQDTDYGVLIKEGFYSLGQIPGNIKNLIIYIGRNMWEVREQANMNLTLSSWIKTPGELQNYIETAAESNIEIEAGSCQKLTGYIYSQNNYVIDNLKLPIDNLNLELYLNSNSIKTFRQEGNNKSYTLILKRGWNRIDLIVAPENSGQAGTMNLYEAGLILKNAGQFYSNKNPLKQTSLHDLYYNTPPQNRDYFALDNNQVIMNYAPVNIIYEYSGQILDLAKISNLIGIRFMAQLTSDTGNTTPRLLRYSLILS